MAVDIGSAAINRNYYASATYTYINLDNPANASGILDTIEVYAYTGGATNVTVAVFYGSGTSYTGRGGTNLGTVAAGSKQTYSGLEICVEKDDYIGFWCATGSLKAASSGSSGVLRVYLNKTGTTATYSTWDSDACLSLYGTGIETVTISDSGGDWSSTGSWTDGFVPTAGMKVVATATSGDLTLDVDTASVGDVDLSSYAATLDFAGMTLTCKTFNISGFNEREIKDTVGGGKLVVTGTSGNVIDIGFADDLTVTDTIDIQLGTGALTLTDTPYCIIESVTFGDLTIKRHAGSYDYTFQSWVSAPSFGAITIETPNADYQKNGLALFWNVTLNCTSFSATGTEDYLIYLIGDESSLSDASGTNTVSYCTIEGIAATGAATWDASDGTNVDEGGNSGWVWESAAVENLISVIASSVQVSDCQHYIDALTEVTGSGVTASDLQHYIQTLQADIASSVQVSDHQHYIDALTNVVGAKVELSDFKGAVETLLSAIGIESALTDSQNYLDTLTEVAGSGVTASDLQDYIQTLQADIASSVQVSDHQHYIDALTSTIGANVELTDFKGAVETLLSAIGIESALTDSQNYLDTLTEVAGAGVTASDLQDYIQTLQADIGSNVQSADHQHYIDTLTSVVGAKVELTDLRSFVETLTSLIGARITLEDVQGYREVLVSPIGGKVTVDDLRHYIDILQEIIGARVDLLDIAEGNTDTLLVRIGVAISITEYYFLEIEFEDIAAARQFSDVIESRSFADTAPARIFTDVAPDGYVAH
jgi:hypothetical protein